MNPTFYLYPADGEFAGNCGRLAVEHGFEEVENPSEATLAIAPKLQRILKEQEWAAPSLGTLIFHPSILPYHRGPDAIRWTVHLGERVSGVTWFWCDGGLDTGPICTQEPVVLKPGESPGRAYHTRFVPAGVVALERALSEIAAGNIPRRDQDCSLASYESWFDVKPE